MLTPQEIAAQTTGVSDIYGTQTINPPQQGGFLQPARGKQRMEPIEYDWNRRKHTYDVLKAKGHPAADELPKFQDIRDFYNTGALPVELQEIYTKRGITVEQPQPQATKQPQTGLFRRAGTEQGNGEITQFKPRWDYSKMNFAPIVTQNDEEEAALQTRFNELGAKWAPAVEAAKQTEFTGTNAGGRGNVQALNNTADMIPWMFKQVFNMNPEEIAKLPPATRREMMGELIDIYHQAVGPQQWEAMGLGNVEKAKQETFKKYGSAENQDDNSWVGGVGTLFKSVGKGAATEVGNVFALAEAEFGDGNVETGVGHAYKAAKGVADWFGEDKENGELTAMKMRLMTLLQQDRLDEAALLVARNGELRMSIAGELLGQIGADAAAMAGVGAVAGSVAPGFGTAVGGAGGAVAGTAKGLFTVGGKLRSLYNMAKAAAKAAPLQAVQSMGTMYSELLDRNVNITPEVKSLVREAGTINALITAFTPGNLEGSIASIAGKIRDRVRAKGVQVSEEKITQSAREIANILGSRGIKAAEGVIEKATPWERVKGAVNKTVGYGLKAAPEAVQEGLTAYNEGATARVNQDGTIRDLTEAEERNRVTQAGFEAILGGVATAPRTFIGNRRLSQENQVLSDAYTQAFKNEQIETEVNNQSEEFQNLYMQAEGTPEERFKMAQDTLNARDQAQRAMAEADASTEPMVTTAGIDTSIDEKLASLTQQTIDNGIEGLQFEYDPLHNYYVPDRKKAISARNTIITSIDRALASGALSDTDVNTLTDLRNQIEQGDLSGLPLLNDETLITSMQANKTNLTNAVNRLSRLQQIQGVETGQDFGLKRFTAGDRNKTAAILTNIQGDSTGIDANDLRSSLLNVRSRLEQARDGAAKQKGLERLAMLDLIVNNDLPENLGRIEGYYRRDTTNKRFTDRPAEVFTGQSGETLLQSTTSNIDIILSSLASQGVDSTIVSGMKKRFKTAVRANPDVAFTQLKQELASLGNSVAQGDQQVNFLNPQRSTNAYLQHAYSQALDAVNEVDNNLQVGAVRPVVSNSINAQSFSQSQVIGADKQSELGAMFDGIRLVLKNTGIAVPSNASLIKNPIGQLRQFQASLAEQPEIAARGNEAVVGDIEQIRSYVNSVLDAFVTGSELPRPSDVMRYYSDLAVTQRQPGGKDTFIPKPRDTQSLTEISYNPKPLSQSEQGFKLFNAKTKYDKAASAFEVVETESGPLVFLNGNDINGKELVNTAIPSDEGLDWLVPVWELIKNNVDVATTPDKMDGGYIGTQEDTILEDVAVATVEEVNAQSAVKLISETDETGRNIGLKRYVDKIMSRRTRHWSQYQWQDSSLAKSISTLLRLADSPDSPINPPRITIRDKVESPNGSPRLAMYVYHQNGGEIVLSRNMTTDANIEDALMHELLHWAISQQQLTYLQYSSSEAVNVMQEMYLDGDTTPADLQIALTKAIADTPDAGGKRLLQELYDVLTLNNDSNKKVQDIEYEQTEAVETANRVVDDLLVEQTEAEENLAGAKQARDEAKQRIADINQQLSNAKTQNKEIADYNSKVDKADKEIASITDKVNKVREKIDSWQQKIEVRQQLLEDEDLSESAKSTHLNEVERLKAQMRSATKDLENLETSLTKKVEALPTRQDAVDTSTLENDLIEAKEEMKAKLAEVSMAQTVVNKLKSEIAKAEASAKRVKSDNHTLTKMRQRQIAFEELMNYLMEKEASGEIDTINGLLHTYFPGTLNSSELIDSVARSLANGIRKEKVKTHSNIFFNGRETYATAKKQPTLVHYGFKEGNQHVTGSPIAYLDPATNSWVLHYHDTQGVPQLIDGLTYTQLSNIAQRMEMWPGRVEKNRVVQKKPAQMMTQLQRFSPAVYKFLSRINKLLRGTDDDLKAPVRQLANIIAGMGVRQQGITSWFKQIENGILNVTGEDVRDQLESKYNEIRQQFQYELMENAVSGEQNIRSLMDKVYKLMRDSGYPKEKIDNMLYALEAENRHSRTLREHPIDPLTGKRRNNNDNLTGFMLPNIDNTDSNIDDSDGSKYRATWTLEEQNFARNLKQMYIDLNNRVLEFEFMAGRMTQKQFNEAYGKFYMPLRNEDDGATAFQKLATGRRSKADSPMTHYQANMRARLKSAEQSMIMQELMDTLAEHPVDGFVSFNATTLTKTDKGRYQQRADGFVKGNTITFFRDGMKFTATVDDPIFAKALKAQRDSASKDDVTSMYMKTMSGIVSLFARVRTQTPPFFVTSLFRDSAMTMLNHQAAFRGRSGLSAMDHQILAVETVAYAANNLANMIKWRANPNSADWRYVVYRKYGGIGHSEQFDLEHTRQQLGENVFDQHKGFLGGVANKGKKGINKWQDIMHASDDLLRFATWLKFVEKKAGRKFTNEADLRSFLASNPDVSRLATDGSKNITGNFQNKGMGNQFERSHFIFWNAAMTGINSALRMLNPRYGMQGIISAGTLFSLMFLQGLSAPDDDDDGKSTFFRIKGLGDGLAVGGIGGVMWTLPQEIQPFSHLATGLSGLITGNLSVGDAAKNVMGGFLKGYTPFTPAETGEPLFDVLYAFTPTVFQPMALRAMGKNFYGGDSLPKAYDADGKEMPDAPNAARVRSSDSGWAVQMAHAAYSATGGAVDMSPGAVEDIPKQVFGGVYSMFNNFFTEYNKNGGDAINAAASALFKGKTVEYNEFALQESVNKRFEKLQTNLRAGEAFDDMFRGKDDLPPEYTEVAKLKKQMTEDIKALTDGGDSLNTIRQRIKQLQLDPSSPQELFELQTRASNIYAQRNYIYGQYMTLLDDLGLD